MFNSATTIQIHFFLISCMTAGIKFGNEPVRTLYQVRNEARRLHAVTTKTDALQQVPIYLFQ